MISLFLSLSLSLCVCAGLPEFDRFNVSVAAMTVAGIGPPSMVVFNMTQEGGRHTFKCTYHILCISKNKGINQITKH